MGAVKSIAIGVVVYFLVVRLLLMAKDEKGVRVYVNRWPEKLDLEDLVYRPVLLKLLPGVCTLVVRFVAELPETVVVFLRDTIFSKRKKHRPVPVGNRFTYACGKAVNGVAMALNATFLKSHPVRTDFEYVFDASWKEFIAGTHLITRQRVLRTVAAVYRPVYHLRLSDDALSAQRGTEEPDKGSAVPLSLSWRALFVRSRCISARNSVSYNA